MRRSSDAGGASAISLGGAGGGILRSTLWPPGELRDGEVGPVWRATVGGRPLTVANIQATTGRSEVAVILPFEVGAAGTDTRYTLSMLMAPQRLLDALAAQHLPPGVHASIMEGNPGVTERRLRDDRLIGATTSVQAATRMVTDEGIARFLDGEDSTTVVAARARGPLSGYWVQVSQPESAFLAPLHRSLVREAAAGTALLGSSLMLALLFTWRRAGSPPFLTAGPTAAAQVSPPGGTGLPEAGTLAAALARAAAQHDQSQADRQRQYASSLVGVAHGDADGRLLAANDSFLRLIGRDRAALEAGDLRWQDLTPPEWLLRDEAAIADAVAWGYCQPYEREFLLPDGSRRPVLLAFARMEDGSGRCTAFAGEVYDRSLIEAALLESQQRLLQSQVAGGASLWELDLASGRLWATPAWLWLHRLAADAGSGSTRDAWLNRVVPEDRDRFAAELDAVAPGAHCTTEVQIASGDGSVRCVELRMRRIGTRLTGDARDLTERRTAQRQRHPDMINAMVTSDIVGIFVTEGTRIEEANGRFLQLLGRSRAELEAGQFDWAACTPAEYRDADAATLRQLRETGSSPAYEKEYVRADGIRVPVLVGSGLIDRATLRRIVFVVDLTERKRAEAAAREAGAVLQTILDATTDRMTVLDTAGRCRFVNRAEVEHLGAGDIGELLGRSWDELWPAGQSETALHAVLAAAAGRPARFSGMMPGQDGEALWWDVAVTPILGADGQPEQILAVSRDITASHAAEDMMHQLNTQLELTVRERARVLSETAEELAEEMRRREEAQAALIQAQKLEALGQLTSGVAHDFNNMLAAIQGSFTLLSKRVHDDTGRMLLANGRHASERAATLIRHLLAFARREELRPIVVDLATIMPGVGELVRQAVGRKVTLMMEPVPADIWRVLVEPHQLEVAVLNLAVNGRDAMPNGGVLTIAARNLPAIEHRPAGLPAGDCVALEVRDTGTGMAPEVLARATEAFFTTKELGKGTGLGLAMVQRMARQLGGVLHIESEAGLGTTIAIVLPRVELRLTSPDPAAAGIDLSLHGNAAVLVVDDDDQVRAVTAGFLRDLTYKVFEANSAAAAFALAVASDRLDLVVTDVAMPGGDGPSLAARLRLEWPDLPIIFVTGFAGDAALGGETVLAKPYNFPDLAQLIAERLGRQQPKVPTPALSSVLPATFVGLPTDAADKQATVNKG